MSNFLGALQKGCKKEQAVYEMDLLGREENGDDLERIGKDKKIGITKFQLVTSSPVEHFSSVSSQLVVIRSVEFEKGCTILQTIVLHLV